MITIKQRDDARERAAEMIAGAGFVLTQDEKMNMEVADFGLSRHETEGAQIAVLADTDYISIKVLALFPNQTLPEHWHIAVNGKPGKEETIRVIKGTLRLYTQAENGAEADTIKEGFIPSGQEEWYTCRKEMLLYTGDQATLPSGKKHWFQAGNDGAVLFDFCSAAVDAMDPFTNPDVVRKTMVI